MDDKFDPLSGLSGALDLTKTGFKDTQQAVDVGGQLQSQLTTHIEPEAALASAPAAQDEKVLVWKREGKCGDMFVLLLNGGKQPPMGKCCMDRQVEMSRSEAEAGGYTIIGPA